MIDIGRLTKEETFELAGNCLDSLTDDDAMQVILGWAGDDEEHIRAGELAAQLEDL